MSRKPLYIESLGCASTSQGGNSLLVSYTEEEWECSRGHKLIASKKNTTNPSPIKGFDKGELFCPYCYDNYEIRRWRENVGVLRKVEKND